MTQAIFRFAPSPNGRLHLGHAYSALVNQQMAREMGGRLLLRIENTDEVRCTPVLEQQMLKDLTWLGISWEGVPRRQCEHGADYRKAVKRLEKMGLVYPGFLSRAEARRRVEMSTAQGESWPCDPDGMPHYPTEERCPLEEDKVVLLEQGKPHTWRLNMAAALEYLDERVIESPTWDEEGAGPDGETGQIEANAGEWGDFMLVGRDGSAAYHLACVVDDAIQGITHVVRGRDLFFATSAHRLLQELLNLPTPQYCHHDLILDKDGRKLSKSRADTSLAQLRAAGATPKDIRKMLGF